MQTFCLTMPFWSRLWSVTQNDTIWVQLFSRDTKTILFKQSSGFLSAKSDSELHHVFGLCLTVHHWYIQYRQPTRCNNKSLLIIPIISTYFGLRFCSSSWAQDCVYSLWYNAPTMLPAGSLEAELPGYRPAKSCVYYATSCKHSLVLLKMGVTIARNMLS